MTRRQLSRREREKRVQRITIITGILAIALVLIIPAYGYWAFIVKPPLEPVTKINATSFNMAYYMKLLRMFSLGQQAAGQQPNYSTFPFELLSIIENNELIRQSAPKLGLTVTDEQVTVEMKKRLLPAPKEGEEPDPVALEKEFQQALKQYLNVIKLKEPDYRQIVKADLLRDHLRDILGQDVPTVAKQVHFRGIMLTDLTPLDEIKQKLKDGTNFASVVQQYSVDEATKQNDGDFGWVPERVQPDFDSALFGLPKGEVSTPIAVGNSFLVVKVLDRSSNQARLQGIQVDTRVAADDAWTRLRNGEKFEDLAKDLSTDPVLKASGGDMGWVSPGLKGDAFDAALFGLSSGKLSDPIGTVDGFFLLQVVERADARTIEDKNREVLKTRALEDWLLEERQRNTIQRSFDSDKYAWAIDEITKKQKQ